MTMAAALVLPFCDFAPSVYNWVDVSSSIRFLRLSADISLSGTLPGCGMLSKGKGVVLCRPSAFDIRGTVLPLSSLRMEARFACSLCMIDVFMPHQLSGEVLSAGGAVPLPPGYVQGIRVFRICCGGRFANLVARAVTNPF